MNAWLVAAGCLLIGVGVVHSWLGERLVFGRLRSGGRFQLKEAPG